MKTGDLISSLASQSGVELTDEQTKVIQEITTELPDEIATKIQGSLFTKESALANPDIINKLKAESLDAVDQKMSDFAKEFGLDEGFLHNLQQTKGTYNRIDSIKKAIVAAQKQAIEKAKTGDGADDKELQKEITRLNNELATLKDTHVTKDEYQEMIDGYEEVITDNANKVLQLQAKGLFSGANWAMDVPSDINVTTAMNLMDQEIAKRDLRLVNDNGQLKLQTKEGTDYFVDNKPVNPQDFANEILAGHKLLKVTDKSPPPANGVTVPTNGLDASVMEAVAKAQALNAEIVSTGGQN